MDPLSAMIGAGASIFNGIFNRQAAQELNDQNIANQIRFAQTGLQWRAQDATRAQDETGINRLTLLGAPTASFSNVTGDTGLGDSISAAGHDIGRAVTAATSQPSRADQLNEKLLEARINNVNADTVRLQAGASEVVRRMGQPGTPPAVPLPPVDMRRVGPAYWAKPLFEDYVGPHGGVVTLPTASASTASQNWMSMPGQIAGAAGLTGENIGNAVRDVGSGITLPGAVWRGVDNSQYAPF